MKSAIATYLRLLGYLRPSLGRVGLAYGGMTLTTLLQLLVPDIVRRAIDTGLAQQQLQALINAALVILVLGLVRGLASLLQLFYGEWLTHRVAYLLRNDFYNRLQWLPFEFHDQARTGDLMSRATSDISESERFVGVGLAKLVETSLFIVGVMVAMALQNVTLALVAMPPLLLMILAAVRFGNVVLPMFKAIQQQMGVLSSTMQESMTGIRLVKSFAREPHELEKFDAENNSWFAKRLKLIQVWANNWPFFTFLLAVSIFLVLWIGGPQVIAGTVTVGTIVALIQYVLMLNGPVQQLGFLVNLAATARASANRVFEIMDTPNPVVEQPDGVTLGDIRGEVHFDQVEFSYVNSSAAVLHDINFTAQPGQKIALIGPTGSGKSSVISLIPRFYDVVGGSVRVDGHDVRAVTLNSLRRQIGIVMQSPFLFSATIAENIAYGRPEATQAEIEAAAAAARAHHFITEFPEGYNTRVGERGVTLSGGQKQRVAIARALLYDPRILILDDSTSSVDTETEHLIQAALVELMEGRTTFIIAQRLLTLKSADLIVVLDGGRIVERGKHDELLAANGLYRRIYDLQLKDQEEFHQLHDTLATAEGANHD